MAAFKRGLTLGFMAGYVMGAKAGRDRYDQINKAWKRLKKTDAYERLSAKAGALLGLGITRGKVIALSQLEKATHRAKDKAEQEGKRGSKVEGNGHSRL